MTYVRDNFSTTAAAGIQPGETKAEDVLLGMKLASLAITDDEEGTLKKISKANPWHKEALKVITGSVEEANKPLSEILQNHMGLTCDRIIDISGFRGGYALDTQGYIAHNDEMIVLAYRCTTSGLDWLTNFTTSTSAWEPHVDIEQGHSGYFSCVEGLCGCGDNYKPRVHTGFYNNFLASAPIINEYIAPLLAPDQPPRKLYVVGHSLGAGIATMASCYMLLNFDWEMLPHKFVGVTAGSPRACCASMKGVIDAKMSKLRPLDKADFYRLVRDTDIVTSVPPSLLGFAHLDELVFITEEGKLLLNPDADDLDTDQSEQINAQIELKSPSSDSDSDDEDDEKAKSRYERKISMVPKAFRDHMPDFYLKPLIALFQEHADESRNMSESLTESRSIEKDEATVGTEGSSDADEEPVKRKGKRGVGKFVVSAYKRVRSLGSGKKY